MNKEQAKKLFDKCLRNECSPQETALLHNFLDSFQDNDVLWSELNYDQEIKDQLWSKIHAAIAIDEKREGNFSFHKYYKYAAIFIGLISGFLWYESTNSFVEGSRLSVADDAIILKTSENKSIGLTIEGEQVLIETNGKIVGQQNGNQISYAAHDEIKELIYNEIEIPYGKKFKLLLSDGSLVHMNSGSSLKYPVNFISGKNRKVFLKGEAYFEVTKNTGHPFLVMTEEMEIRVLGTHFNVSSYKGSETFTVLAEGSVVVYDKKSPDVNFKTIRPGEKALILDNAIAVTEVDLNAYLGWREGLLVFHNKPFFNIIQQLERHYGVTIENEFPALETTRFRGFFKEESITDLMDTFKESAGFEYTIQDNKIIIKAMKK